AFTEARLPEVRELLDRAEALGPGVDGAPLPVVDRYDDGATTYDAEDNGRFPLRDALLAPPLDARAPRPVPDAACGTGAVSARLVARGHEVIGIDLSEGMPSRARAAVPQARFEHGALTAMPLADGAVRHVVCSLALTHLPDLAPFFAEAARVMRPGGRL